MISKYSVIFEEPPVNIPSTFSVDAPLLGNGSTGVAIGGPPENQTYYLARNDFWRLKESYNESFPCVLGRLQLAMPALKGASYRVEQDLYTGTTYQKFENDIYSVNIRVYVSANEDLLIIEIENEGKGPVKGELVLKIPQEEAADFQSLMSRNIDRNLQWISREFNEDVAIPTKAACAMKIMDASSNRFYLKKNETLYVALAFSSNFKSGDCSKDVFEKIQQLAHDSVAAGCGVEEAGDRLYRCTNLRQCSTARRANQNR